MQCSSVEIGRSHGIGFASWSRAPVDEDIINEIGSISIADRVNLDANLASGT
jgi:hypothetical protein